MKLERNRRWRKSEIGGGGEENRRLAAAVEIIGDRRQQWTKADIGGSGVRLRASLPKCGEQRRNKDRKTGGGELERKLNF